MAELKKIREAVEWYDSLPPWQLDNPDERIVTAFEAARQVLNAPVGTVTPMDHGRGPVRGFWDPGTYRLVRVEGDG